MDVLQVGSIFLASMQHDVESSTNQGHPLMVVIRTMRGLDLHTQSSIECRQRHWHREDEWSTNAVTVQDLGKLSCLLNLSFDDHQRHLGDIGFYTPTS
jgi:hypothetical protein